MGSLWTTARAIDGTVLGELAKNRLSRTPIQKEGTFGDVPSLFRAKHRGSAERLVGNVCGNDNEFGFAIVLGHLDLGLAHRELATRGIAFRPNLIKE